ncbi:hypothetical protein pEaSNUABM37_00037 [Erwinia phage pEa_SNUABM_37]|nr:hypothetical protein pEaSNUABM37_00037 [Erwinia phage pEa_SNUABM_37]QXO10507.1 hypothetical protein pEaSNUABM48_00037 [Erwinia phage pEa_SNUABM_48]
MKLSELKAYIYWDFDDVLGRTHAQMLYLLKYIFGYVAPDDIYLTPGNTDGRMAYILDNPTFMRTTGFDYRAVAAWKRIQEMFPNIENGLATHRGYHADGEPLTMALLDEHCFKFDSYHFIDPAVHGKDKMAYLRALHDPDDIVILIDDNTFYDHDQYPNSFTVLIDKPWNQQIAPSSAGMRVDTSGIYEAVEALLCFATIKAPFDERAA